MEMLVSALLFLHVSAGFISLVLFWLPVFLKKGGKGHVITGKLYVASMWVVVVSAALLSIKNVVIGQYTMAAFLGFIALITGNVLWYGIAILKPRAHASKTFTVLHTVMDAVVVLSGLGLLIYGIMMNGEGASVLMIIFGIAGLTDTPNLIKKLRGTAEKEDRIKGHMRGLLSSGIAAYSAFFVFGAYTWIEKLLPGMWGIIPWVGPGLIGGIGIALGIKYYRKKGLISQEIKSA